MISYPQNYPRFMGITFWLKYSKMLVGPDAMVDKYQAVNISNR
jgi:hypothetical protein